MRGRRRCQRALRTRCCPACISKSPRSGSRSSPPGMTSRRAWTGTGPGWASTPWSQPAGRPRADGRRRPARLTSPCRCAPSPRNPERGARTSRSSSCTPCSTRRWSGWPPCWSGTRSTAEEVVQDAFIAMHDGWHRLKDTEKALAYLRQAVVNRSRSVLRHRMVVEKNAAEAGAGYAERRTRRHGPARAVRGHRRAPRPARTTAGGHRPALLRGPVRGGDRRRDADQPRRGEESHRARPWPALKAALEQDA